MLLLTIAATIAAPQAEGRARIIIYRGSGIVGLVQGCAVNLKGRELADLTRGKYIEVDVAPGQHVLTNEETTEVVTVGPRETAYVRCSVKVGFGPGWGRLRAVPKATFDKRRGEYEPIAPMVTIP